MLDRKKLALLCEMLRSDNDHERSVAARMATDLVRRANTTWSQVILEPVVECRCPPPPAGPKPAAQPSQSSSADGIYPFKKYPHRTPERNGVSAAKLIPLLLKKRLLTEWERQRVTSMQLEDLAVGLRDEQWRELIRLAIEFGLWPGTKATGRKKKRPWG